jgi:hypothetical protein
MPNKLKNITIPVSYLSSGLVAIKKTNCIINGAINNVDAQLSRCKVMPF